MRRFWKSAEVVEAGDGFGIALDGRPVKTPARADLIVPTWVLADAIAAEILKRCNGDATFASIVDELATTFSAPRDRIQADVSKLLSGLAEKTLLEL